MLLSSIYHIYKYCYTFVLLRGFIFQKQTVDKLWENYMFTVSKGTFSYWSIHMRIWKPVSIAVHVAWCAVWKVMHEWVHQMLFVQTPMPPNAAPELEGKFEVVKLGGASYTAISRQE